ncbi:penicillin-binding protein [Bacillus testis]|uniref:penicillin-binding protein n=1 Tax=Bacillus testis TaxID=1622072 RepID=UPI00067EB9F9|nr:penicillin-binding protein [Bacillus testis]
MKSKNINVGAAILFIIFGLLFFLLAGRFLYIQITGKVDGEVLAAKAKEKIMKHQVIEAKRGSILDRNGSVIAEDTSTYKLVAILSKKMTIDPKEPNHVVDPEETASKLAKYIDLDESAILKILSNKKAFQVEFGIAGRDISPSVKKKIEALKLPGITFERETKRFYPNGIFASHVVGYAEKQLNEEENESQTTGKLGLEKMLNSKLQGKNGYLNFESDRWGFLLPDKEKKITPAVDGQNVELTLDKKIQTFLEDSLTKVQKEYNPKKLYAIVSNPKTGEIYAMSQRPTFNPSTKEGLDKTWQNLSIEENIEPGSTMKVYTLAAAVEEGVFSPNATFVSKPYNMPGGHPKDHSGIPIGTTLTYLQAVQRSSNVGFVKIALEQLGTERFREYLTKFGFDKKTGIDLPNEVDGEILFNKKIEQATTAFGQGSVITPIQQMQAFSAIANEGKMMKPYVIKKITDAEGSTVEETKPTVAGTPISAKTANTVLGYLETVVSDEKATGTAYALDGYKVAGKTGTAQIPGPDGRYLTGRNNYLFSFIGAVPAENPQLTMYIAMQQPELPADKTATDGMAAIFKPVMQNALHYLNIKPADQKSKKVDKIIDYTDQNVVEAQEDLKKKGYEVSVFGKGTKVAGQAPAEGATLIEGERIILKTDGDATMPDVTGWSLRDVMKVANLVGMDLNTTGSGYVIKQNIKPGQVIKKGDYCILHFSPPEETAANQDKPTTEDQVYD